MNYITVNDKWQLNQCSCFKWCKEYVCKHSIAFNHRKESIKEYPIQAKQVLIGCNRRRGRPRLTASALEFQHPLSNTVVECVLSDTESEGEQTVKKNVRRKRKAVSTPDVSEEEYDFSKKLSQFL